MELALNKIEGLHKVICDLQAKLQSAAGENERHRERTRHLEIENDELREHYELGIYNLQQKEAELEKTKEKLDSMTEENDRLENQLRQIKRQLDVAKCDAKTQYVTINEVNKGLHREVESLKITNKELVEKQNEAETTITEIIRDASTKAQEAVDRERDRVKTLIEYCRQVVAKLNLTVKENAEKELRMECEIRHFIDTIQHLKSTLVDNQLAYKKWMETLDVRSYETEYTQCLEELAFNYQLDEVELEGTEEKKAENDEFSDVEIFEEVDDCTASDNWISNL